MNIEINHFIKKISENNFTINVFDLNKITKIVYGVPIEMVLVYNNTIVEFSVNKNQSNEEREEIVSAITNESLEKSKYNIILNDLCIKNQIPIGEYKIEVKW